MKTVLRNLISLFRRFRIAMILNVLGLTIGFSAFVLIMMQVKYDYTFNHSIPEANHIFRVEIKIDGSWMTPFSHPYSEMLFYSSPLIQEGTSIIPQAVPFVIEVNKDGIKQNYEEFHYSVLPNYPQFFSFEMVEGYIYALEDPEKVLIPESLARKIWKEQSAVGKHFITEGSLFLSDGTFTVGGVYKDMPANSSVKNGIYVSVADDDKDNWNVWSQECYLKITDPKRISEVLLPYFENHHVDFVESKLGISVESVDVRLTPFTELHYTKNVLYDPVEKANKQTLFILIGIAFVLLIIAAINYTNFSVALTPVRIKSINTQKVLGAAESVLRRSLLAETLLICLFSFVLSVLVVHLFLNTSFREVLYVGSTLSGNLSILLFTGLVALIIAIGAGLYPAYYSTSFSPALVLKGAFGCSPRGRQLRNILIGFQYVASFVLIIGSSFMVLQNRFMQNSYLGYQKEQLLVSTLNSTVLQNKDALRNELLGYAGIDQIAFAESLLSGSDNKYKMYTRPYRDGQDIRFYCLMVDHAFPEVMGIQVTEGRTFREEDEINSGGLILFNERARMEYGLKIGEKVYEDEIVGFVPDVRFLSFRQEMSPMAFQLSNDYFEPEYLYIKTKAGVNLQETKAIINATLQKMDPGYPFQVLFYDQVIQGLYDQESKMSLLISLFSFIAIFISIVGVFGLVIFDGEYKVKEIGIRKVMGSTTTAILLQYNKIYLIIVFICFIIAAPIAYVIVNNWLENFIDRVSLSPFVFIFSFFIISFITILTVTFQNWRIANINPVRSLKSE